MINIITKNFQDLPGPARQVAFNGQARTGGLNTQLFDGVLTVKTKDLAVSVTARLLHSDEQDLSRYPDMNFDAREASDYTNQLNVTDINPKTGKYKAEEYLARTQLTTRFPNSPLYSVDYDGAGKATALRLTPQGAQQAARLDNTLFGGTLNGQPVRYSDETYEQLYRVKIAFQAFTLSYMNWRTTEGATPWFNNTSTLSTDDNPRWITHNRALSLTYTKRFSDRFQLLNLTSYLVHELDGNSNLVAYKGYYNGRLGLLQLAKDTVPVATTTYHYRLSLQLRNECRLFWSPTYNLDVTSGVEVRSGLIQGSNITALKPLPNETGTLTGTQARAGGNNFQTTEVGVYSQATYRPLPKLKVVGGIRVDNSRIRTNGGYGYVANPRASVIYSITPRLVLKTTYAEAFKDATWFQKYGSLNGNPNLPPERVRNLEGGTYFQASKQASFNLLGYYSDYSAVAGISGNRRIGGLQGEGSYRTTRLTAWVNASYTVPMDVDSAKRISDIADFTVNAGADYQVWKQLHVYLSGNLVGPRETGRGTVGSFNPQQRFPAYCIFNANLTYPEVWVRGVGVQVSVTNLLNTEYAVPGIRGADNTLYVSRYPQEGRLFSLALLYTLQPAANR